MENQTKPLRILIVEDEVAGKINIAKQICQHFGNDNKVTEVLEKAQKALGIDANGISEDCYRLLKEVSDIEIDEKVLKERGGCPDPYYPKKIRIKKDRLDIYLVSKYEDANQALNEKFDKILCDFNFPYNKETSNILKTEILNKSDKTKWQKFFNKLEEPFKKNSKKFENIDEVIDSLIEQDMLTPAPLLGVKANEKGVPCVFFTGELFHAITPINLAVYLGVIDGEKVAESINELKNKGYSSISKIDRDSLYKGIILAPNLVMGYKDHEEACEVAVKKLEEYP